MMEPQTMRRLALKPDQQGLECVDPCERALTNEAMVVRRRVAMPFPAARDCLSVAFVFGNGRVGAASSPTASVLRGGQSD